MGKPGSEDRGLHREVKGISTDNNFRREHDPQVIGALFLGTAGDGGDEDLVADHAGLFDQHPFGAEIGNLEDDPSLVDVGLKLDGDGSSKVDIPSGNILVRDLIAGGLLNRLPLEPGQNSGINPDASLIAGYSFLPKTGTEKGDDHESDAEEVFAGHDCLPFPAFRKPLLTRLNAIVVPPS